MTRRTRTARARLLRPTGTAGGIAGSVFGTPNPRESRRLAMAAFVALTAYAIVGTWAARTPRRWLPHVLRAPQMTVELLRPRPTAMLPLAAQYHLESSTKRRAAIVRPSLTAPAHTAVAPKTTLQPVTKAPAEAPPNEKACTIGGRRRAGRGPIACDRPGSPAVATPARSVVPPPPKPARTRSH